MTEDYDTLEKILRGVPTNKFKILECGVKNKRHHGLVGIYRGEKKSLGNGMTAYVVILGNNPPTVCWASKIERVYE